jgi:excisionase family DNA binding protein
MHDLKNPADLLGPDSDSARRRRLDELFADQPYLSTTMRAASLHDRMADEPPAIMVPVLTEMVGDDLTTQLERGRRQRMHAVTFDIEEFLASAERAPAPAAEREPVASGQRSLSVPVLHEPRTASPEAKPVRIELLLDCSTDPPRVMGSAEVAATPDVMTSREAAKFLRIGVASLRTRANNGSIPSARVGRQVRFRREALLQWLTDNEATASK